MRVTLPVVLVTLVVSGSTALAQDKKDDEKAKKEAKRLILQGDASFAKKDYKAALIRYQQAYDAFPSAKIFYPLAQSEEKLGLDLEALVHYEQLLDEAGNDISSEVKTEAKVRIGQIEQRLALVRFEVKPAGTRVLVDEIEYGDLSRPIRLKPGVHKYSLQKDGFKPVEGSLELKAGAREQVKKELQPGAGPVTPGPKPVEKVVDSGGEPRPSGGAGRPVFYAGLAATGALGVGTLVVGILAVRKHGIYVDETKPIDVRQRAQDKGKTYALATDGLLLGTVAAGAFTAYWYFYVYAPNREVSAPTGAANQTRVAPYVWGDGGGLLVEGTF